MTDYILVLSLFRGVYHNSFLFNDNKKAEKKFIELVQLEGAKDKNLDDLLDDGYFDSDLGVEIFIIHPEVCL